MEISTEILNKNLTSNFFARNLRLVSYRIFSAYSWLIDDEHVRFRRVKYQSNKSSQVLHRYTLRLVWGQMVMSNNYNNYIH